MCRIQFKDRDAAKDLMLILGLNDTIGHLDMANTELAWSCVLE